MNADIAQLDAIMVSEEDKDVNPLKGIGELANVGTAAAISNATGKRIRKLPIRIEDVLVM